MSYELDVPLIKNIGRHTLLSTLRGLDLRDASTVMGLAVGMRLGAPKVHFAKKEEAEQYWKTGPASDVRESLFEATGYRPYSVEHAMGVACRIYVARLTATLIDIAALGFNSSVTMACGNLKDVATITPDNLEKAVSDALDAYYEVFKELPAGGHERIMADMHKAQGYLAQLREGNALVPSNDIDWLVHWIAPLVLSKHESWKTCSADQCAKVTQLITLAGGIQWKV